MSVNVRQHCDAVKTKIVISAALVLAAVLGLAQAGPQLDFCAGGRRMVRSGERSLSAPIKPYPKFVIAPGRPPTTHGIMATSRRQSTLRPASAMSRQFSTTAKREFTAFRPPSFLLRR